MGQKVLFIELIKEETIYIYTEILNEDSAD